MLAPLKFRQEFCTMRKHLERDELRYAIWLNPDALCVELVTPIMDKLRLNHRGPAFDPHLTLTSGITGSEGQIINTFHSCAEAQSPFKLRSEGIGVSGSFFRAITVGYHLTTELSQFRSRVRQHFSLEAHNNYHPHLSLAYGEIPDAALQDTKNKLTQHQWPDITISSISLWRLKGPVENWRMMANAALTD